MRRMLLNCLILLLSASISTSASAATHMYLEKDYQNVWCSLNNGVSEYMLPDKTRVDCVTKDYAIEFDFANKWAEAIGQALYYSVCLGKSAGVVLILEKPTKDNKYLNRLLSVAKLYNITVWSVTPEILLNKPICDN